MPRIPRTIKLALNLGNVSKIAIIGPSSQTAMSRIFDAIKNKPTQLPPMTNGVPAPSEKPLPYNAARKPPPITPQSEPFSINPAHRPK